MSKIKEQKQFVFENERLFYFICGIADQNILELEKFLDVELIPRGNSFIIRSDNIEKINNSIEFFQSLCIYFNNREIEPFDLKYLFENFKKISDDNIYEVDKIFTTIKGKPIYAKTIHQKNYISSILKYPITIAIGPAGTGKTYLSVVVASKLLLKGEIDRLIITRPAVEAGENLGFLPGDLVQKVDPYLRPIYDSLYEILGVEKTNQFIQLNKIEVAPIAYMRGRTLNDSMIILDEAQNCTLTQLKMILTRLGRNSKMCISGDVTQSDLKPGKSGLIKLIHILKDIKEISFIQFDKQDIVRNPIVEKIIHAFDKYENNNES